jgi:hypothetical protein
MFDAKDQKDMTKLIFTVRKLEKPPNNKDVIESRCDDRKQKGLLMVVPSKVLFYQR